MADHLDAPSLVSPDKAPVDITDIYAFQKPGDPTKSILIMNVNPFATAPAFSADSLYELKVDTNGDALADVAFRIKFSPFEGGSQTADVRLASGSAATGRENTGTLIFDDAPVSFGSTATVTDSDSFRFFAGIRSDPFFFDLLGFLGGLVFTGDDFFKDKDVFGIALEVPNTELGPNPNVGIWGRVLESEQIDRMGRPAINTVFMSGKDKDKFNRSEPNEDVARFTDDVVAVLTSFGYSVTEAAGIAAILLPDVLTYDYSSSAGFLNGRNLTDDVIDIELAIVTNGTVTTDGVSPHKDLRKVFPYMGRPHK